MTPPPVENGPWYPINTYRKHGFEAGRYWINADARVYDLTIGRYLRAGHRKSASERAQRRHQKYMRVQPRNAENKQVSCLLHVLLWYAVYPETPWEGVEIDHIDSDTGNNRLANLRALPWAAHREKTVSRRRALSLGEFDAIIDDVATPLLKGVDFRASDLSRQQS